MVEPGDVEVQTDVSLYEKLPQPVNHQVQNLIALVKQNTPSATKKEQEKILKIYPEEGYMRRLWRAITGGEPMTQEEYIYSKTVAAVAREEKEKKKIELVGRWVDESLQDITIVSIEEDWMLHLKLDENERLIGSSLSEGIGKSRDLSLDEITRLLDESVEFSLDEDFINEQIDKNVLAEFQAMGGEIVQVVEDEIPDDANVIELCRLGGEGREGTRNVGHFKVVRPDKTEVFVETSSWGVSPLPDQRDILAVVTEYEGPKEAVAEAEEIKKPVEYGPAEKELGVAVNRETASLQEYGGDTIVYRDEDTRIVVSIEDDESLQAFLKGVKEGTEALGDLGALDKAKAVARIVVERTPNIDESGELHRSQLHLGDLLENGVQCVSRALAVEASFKMTGATKKAQMLMAVDYKGKRHIGNHADVEFSIGNEDFVAISMGERAGDVLPEEEYMGGYLKERERKGLGKRRIEESWGRSYFEAV